MTKEAPHERLLLPTADVSADTSESIRRASLAQYLRPKEPRLVRLRLGLEAASVATFSATYVSWALAFVLLR
jgi:hypothetical protein